MGTNDTAPARRGTAPAPRKPRVVSADQLFGAEPEIRIRHRGQEYRLRKTRNGKLILTK